MGRRTVSLKKAMQSNCVETIRSALQNGATVNFLDSCLEGSDHSYYALTEFLASK